MDNSRSKLILVEPTLGTRLIHLPEWSGTFFFIIGGIILTVSYIEEFSLQDHWEVHSP